MSSFRRVLQEKEAGLVFSWRVGRGSVRRTMMAVVLATVIFTTGILLLRVEGSEQVRGRREAARMMVLVPGSEASKRWLSWARQEAPGLDRWELELGGRLQGRMEGLEMALMRETRHEALLYPPEEMTRRSLLPPIIDVDRPSLPQMERDTVAKRGGGMIEGQITMEVCGALRERWSDYSMHTVSGQLLKEGNEAEGGVRPRDLLGLDRRFLISVNRRGEIETCLVLNPEDQELDELLARWLRRQCLNPGEEDLLWGRVRVQVRGLPKEVNKIGTE